MHYILKQNSNKMSGSSTEGGNNNTRRKRDRKPRAKENRETKNLQFSFQGYEPGDLDVNTRKTRGKTYEAAKAPDGKKWSEVTGGVKIMKRKETSSEGMDDEEGYEMTSRVLSRLQARNPRVPTCGTELPHALRRARSLEKEDKVRMKKEEKRQTSDKEGKKEPVDDSAVYQELLGEEDPALQRPKMVTTEVTVERSQEEAADTSTRPEFKDYQTTVLDLLTKKKPSDEDAETETDPKSEDTSKSTLESDKVVTDDKKDTPKTPVKSFDEKTEPEAPSASPKLEKPSKSQTEKPAEFAKPDKPDSPFEAAAPTTPHSISDSTLRNMPEPRAESTAKGGILKTATTFGGTGDSGALTDAEQELLRKLERLSRLEEEQKFSHYRAFCLYEERRKGRKELEDFIFQQNDSDEIKQITSQKDKEEGRYTMVTLYANHLNFELQSLHEYFLLVTKSTEEEYEVPSEKMVEFESDLPEVITETYIRDMLIKQEYVTFSVDVPNFCLMQVDVFCLMKSGT